RASDRRRQTVEDVSAAVMTVRMRWMIIGLALAATGCASSDVGPTPAELKARWDAQNVAPEDYKNDLLAFMRTYLNDRQRISNAQASKPVLKNVGPGDRFIVCVRYRSRKTDGTYGPPKDGAATFVSGRLERFIDVPLQATEL